MSSSASRRQRRQTGGRVSGSTAEVAQLSSLFQAALTHHERNEYDQAEAVYRQMLAIDPKLAMPWSNLGAILHETSRSAEAVEACRRALAITPHHLNALLNLSTAQAKLGDFVGAAATYDEILRHHPQRADLRLNLVDVLRRAGREDEALAIVDRTLASEPTSIGHLMARGEILRKLQRAEEAIAAFAEIVRLEPDNAIALSSLGIMKALDSLDNDLDLAANLCLKAANLRPESGPILNNLAVVLQVRGDTDNALAVLRELVKQQPGFAPAYSNIGSILGAMARYDEAEDAFLKTLSIDPNATEAKIELTKVHRHICDWSQADEDVATIHRLVGRGVNFLIVLMTVSTTCEEQFVYARTAMAAYNATRRPRPVPAQLGSRKIRIGYISADFRDHPVGRLMPDVVKRHDRERFDVFGYSLSTGTVTPLFARYADGFDAFIDLHRVSDADAAQRIRDDGIDILIDLTGPTANSRFDIVALRPAPVQVSFLGMPGTCGADALDYIVADPFLVPAGFERFYHEKVVRLPHCYQPGDPQRPLPETRPTRAECGLPDDGIVFCSFNSPVKITPEVFDVWMRLLEAVEGSTLWLYCKAAKTQRNLLARAAQRGIAAERIVFASAVPFASYLARMSCADLFLDTFPYAAGATCNDALWIGLPVLTLVGETYVSRMAGSLLSTHGFPELIAHSLEEYEATALRLARDPARLQDIRTRLEAARTTSPLFDMGSFTKSLESAYATMIETAATGAEPAAISIRKDE